MGPKILLYSHDTVGLGNARRTLRLCAELVRQYPDAAALILTGSPMIHGLPLPERTDYVKVPCIDRVHAEVYRARTLLGHTHEVKRARRSILLAAAGSFDPDLVIVDKRPTGLDGELLPALELLRSRGRAKLVVGMRDVLDEPARTHLSLRRSGSFEVMERFYDEVWIYGSPVVFDPLKEYGFTERVIRKTHFCGYLGSRLEPGSAVPRLGDPGVLVTAGGGQDGGNVVRHALEAMTRSHLPHSLRARIVFGPQMPERERAEMRGQYAHCSGVRFDDFLPELAPLYAAADVVVCMAGYNTICELLSHDRPAVLVPRVEPVQEQLIRARRLAELGLFEIVEPDCLSPDALLAGVLRALDRPRQPLGAIDLDGLVRVGRRVHELLGGTR